MTSINTIPKIILALITVSVCQAQSLVPESVNSAGASLSQGNVSLSFTVGELAVLTFTDVDGNTISGGFIAGTTLSAIGIYEPDASIIGVTVYPNPTPDILNIHISQASIDQVYISLIDMLGREVYSGRYATLANVISMNMTSYAAGTYVLRISDKNKNILGLYKIIKK
jgi:hypothetical protein